MKFLLIIWKWLGTCAVKIAPRVIFSWPSRVVLLLIISIAFGWFSIFAYETIQMLPETLALPIYGRIEDSMLLGGVSVIALTFLALLPFSIPPVEGLNLPNRFELSLLFSGGAVALAGALFLIGEYEDQKQARITRAWDLLHKATERAYDRKENVDSSGPARGNDGQLGALRTLNEAGIELDILS